MKIAIGQKPSAWAPVVMSLCALAMSLVFIEIHFFTEGVAPQRGAGGVAGVVAHLWQLLMWAQIPVIAFFAFRWIREAPWQAVTVLIVQAVAAASAAVLPVLVLGW